MNLYGVVDSSLGEAIAHWLGEQKGKDVRFEKVEPGKEQVLEHGPHSLDRGRRRVRDFSSPGGVTGPGDGRVSKPERLLSPLN